MSLLLVLAALVRGWRASEIDSHNCTEVTG